MKPVQLLAHVLADAAVISAVLVLPLLFSGSRPEAVTGATA